MNTRIFPAIVSLFSMLATLPCGIQAAGSGTLTATATDSCRAYVVTVQGSGLSKPSKVDYTIDLAPASGSGTVVGGTIRVKPDSNGDFSGRQLRRWSSFGVTLDGKYRLSGSATLEQGGATATISFSKVTLSCGFSQLSFCPSSKTSFDSGFGYAALMVGDPNNQYQNAQIQSQQGSLIDGFAAIPGPHGSINVTSWPQYDLPGIIESAWVQPDTTVSLDPDSYIPHGVHIDQTDPPEAAANAVDLSSEYGAMSATLGPSSIDLQGQQNQPAALTITGTRGVNVVALTQLQMQYATLTLAGPSGAQFVIDVNGQMNLRNSNIVVSGFDSKHVLINVTSNQNLQIQNQNYTGPGSQTVVQATILAPLSNVQLQSAIVSGELISGQQLQIQQDSIVYGCEPASSSGSVRRHRTALPRRRAG